MEDYLSIGRVIERLIPFFAAEAADINEGECDLFADEVVRRVAEARAVWDYDLDATGRWNHDHCFVEYKGKYYDSECPQGVDSWEDLPYFKRSTPMSEILVKRHKRE